MTSLLETRTKEKDEQIKAVQRQLQETKTEYSDQLSSLQSQLKVLDSSKGNHEKTVSQWESRTKQLEKEKSTVEARVTDLQSELSIAVTKRQEDIAKSSANYDRVIMTLNNEIKAMNELLNENQVSREQIIAGEEKVSLLQAEVKSLHETIKTERSNTEVTNKKRQVVQKQIIDDIKSQHEEAQKGKAALQLKIDELNLQLQTALAIAEQADTSGTPANLNRKIEQLESLIENQTVKYTLQIKDKENVLSQSARELSQFKTESSVETQLLLKIQKELESKITQFESTAIEKQELISKLEKDLEETLSKSSQQDDNSKVPSTSDHSEGINRVKREMEEKLQALREEAEIQKKIAESLKNENVTLQKLLTEKETEIKIIDSHFETFKVEAMHREAAESAKVEAEARTSAEEISRLSAAIEDMSILVKVREEDLMRVREELSRLKKPEESEPQKEKEDQVSSLIDEAEIEEMKLKLQEVEKRLAEEKELSEQKAFTEVILEKRLTRAVTEKADLERKLREADEKLNVQKDLALQKITLDSKLADLKLKLEEVETAASSTEATLRTQLKSLAAECLQERLLQAKLIEEIEQLTKNHKDTIKQLAEKEKLLIDIQNQSIKQKTGQTKSTGIVESSSQQPQNAEQMVKRLREENDGLKNEVSSLCEIVAQKEQVLIEQFVRIATLTRQLQGNANHMRQLIVELDELKNPKSTSSLVSAGESMRDLEDRIEMKTEENAKLQSMIRELTAKPSANVSISTAAFDRIKEEKLILMRSRDKVVARCKQLVKQVIVKGLQLAALRSTVTKVKGYGSETLSMREKDSNLRNTITCLTEENTELMRRMKQSESLAEVSTSQLKQTIQNLFVLSCECQRLRGVINNLTSRRI